MAVRSAVAVVVRVWVVVATSDKVQVGVCVRLGRGRAVRDGVWVRLWVAGRVAVREREEEEDGEKLNVGVRVAVRVGDRLRVCVWHQGPVPSISHRSPHTWLL